MPGWQQLPLTDAAQAVQRTAFPKAYAQWEADATQLYAAVADGAALVGDCGGHVGPQGWIAPVNAPVVSGFRTADRPGHDGVDLGAARGTPIRAAAVGTVTVVVCNVKPASHTCDRDGSPEIQGCGWYAEISHATGVATRYCHMASRPLVTEGQLVAAGQPLGYVGSSGNSSGPHLHFEVYLANQAVDPVPFMAGRAAALGRSSLNCVWCYTAMNLSGRGSRCAPTSPIASKLDARPGGLEGRSSVKR